MPHMLTGSLLGQNFSQLQQQDIKKWISWTGGWLIYYSQAAVCASTVVMKIDFAQVKQCYSAIYRQTALRETGTMRVKCVAVVFTFAWLCTVGYGKSLLHS